MVLDASNAGATSVWRTSAPVLVFCGYRSGGLAAAQHYRCHRLAVSENRGPTSIFIDSGSWRPTRTPLFHQNRDEPMTLR